ncbi:helix-turn-helix domain-containing protein [Microbacterium ulmi]|uniref:Helix-turn-helix domain-containing protein n=1 Tax=Microbacterium ulmi TaxID=179095 RepID=A0A7Y2LX30_9MICO|nr:helix-turn-helix domain-containing protein [Microbacterium ulmi]NII71108.1 AraC-like DNA-binding protein [Microbacterium ulmi]NNH02415.1 helix-turn-helix domain-containing protein [Microbacterium ulmi]
MGAILDLEELPITDSIEFLRDRMLNAPVPLALEPHLDADMIARTRTADLGCVHVLSTKSQGADIVRTPQLARDATRPSLMVSVVDHGMGIVVRGDRVMALHPGEIGLYVTDEPYRLAFTPGALRHTYQVPLDELGLSRQLIADQLDVVIHPDRATTAAVSAFLRSTARNAPGATAAEQAALQQPTLDLIRLLLTRPVAQTPHGREAAATSLATRIEEHVRTRLGDPELSARSIAATFSISERYVYSILARRGIELSDLIREHRLAQAIRMLEDPESAMKTISEVAHRCGFSDHAHFSRTFRARFGIAPSDWRRDALSRHARRGDL